MEKCWIIVTRDGRRLGPFTTEDVSRQLTEGGISPLDQAMDSSGADLRQIAEINAFFMPSVDSTTASSPTEQDTLIQAIGAIESAESTQDQAKVERRRFFRQATPSPSTSNKRYYVTKRDGSYNGPYSSQDILYFYKSGRIHGSAKVRIIDTTSSISVESFTAQRSHHKQSRARQTTAKHRPNRFKSSSIIKSLNIQIVATIIAIFAGGTLGGAWYYLVFVPANKPALQVGPVTIETEEEVYRKHPSNSQIPLRGDSQTAARKQQKALRKKKSRRSPTKSQVTPSKQIFAKISQLKFGDGTVVKVGPLYFSEGNLASCKVKCTLPMQDPSGGSILAVFFKAAYFSKLQGKSKGVLISGRLQNHGLSLLVSKVH